jgi:uracil-DNA glycosylase
MKVTPDYPTLSFNGIALVGEAPGKEEELFGRPFVGPTGRILDKMLEHAGIERKACFITNVFDERPPGNDLKYFTSGARDARRDYQVERQRLIQDFPAHAWPKAYAWPSLVPGGYCSPRYLGCLARLHAELGAQHPTVIVAAGNTATWALLNRTGITKLRGSVAISTALGGTKVLPTFHPSAVNRDWSLRPTVVADLQKALRESTSREFVRRRRVIRVPETLFEALILIHSLWSAKSLSIDIETRFSTIESISFSPTPDIANVFLFYDASKPGRSYWTKREEVTIVGAIRRLLMSPIPKTFQNGLYDIQYIWVCWKCPVLAAAHDTMLLHHSLQPELPKSLGFMGSVYTDEIAWKLLEILLSCPGPGSPCWDLHHCFWEHT